MQSVSRKVLKELLKGSGGIVESDNEISYLTDFIPAHVLAVETAQRGAIDRSADLMEMAYEDLKQGWLKEHCPPIKYISEGSSRAAYAFSGGKCLKISMNIKGVAQTRQEVLNTGVGQEDSNKYSCFTQNYAYDKKLYGSLLTECCDNAVMKEDFNIAFGVRYGLDSVIGALKALNLRDFDLKLSMKDLEDESEKIQRSIKAGEDDYEVYDLEQVLEWKHVLDLMRRGESGAELVLADLLQFYLDHGKSDDALLIDDLDVIDNWRLGIRDGMLVPVIIDAGFSSTVQTSYY